MSDYKRRELHRPSGFALAKRLRAKGLTVEIQIPRRTDTDWADLPASERAPLSDLSGETDFNRRCTGARPWGVLPTSPEVERSRAAILGGKELILDGHPPSGTREGPLR